MPSYLFLQITGYDDDEDDFNVNDDVDPDGEESHWLEGLLLSIIFELNKLWKQI